MSFRKVLYSKNFLIFNLVLIGLIIGFCISLFSFSCSAKLTVDKIAHAEDPMPEDIKSLESLQNAFRYVSNKVLPVVVTVNVVEITTQKMPGNRDFPWRFFFEDRDKKEKNDNENDNKREFRNEGLGSGIIVKKAGKTVYVLTNNHVVGKADEISITLFDEREFKGKLVGKDQRKDLALVSFETDDRNLPVAVLGDSEKLNVGDWVLAVGNPYGFTSSVTSGIISALGREGMDGNINKFIQTDASINQGNSGGPLVNIYGEVIGINTWITTPTGGSIGLGFAVPINNAKKTIDDFIKFGEPKYGWLGISMDGEADETLKELSIFDRKGAFVSHVFKDSPAYKSGLLPGDFIIGVDNEKIKNSKDLTRIVGDLMAGDRVNFRVIRNKKEKSFTVSISARGDEETIASLNKKLWPGISIMPITKEIRKEYKIADKQKGVIVRRILKKTPSDISGIKMLDIITKIDGFEIRNAADFYRALNSNRKSREIRFRILRQGSVVTIGMMR